MTINPNTETERDLVRAYVKRFQALDEQLKELNEDRRELCQEAKGKQLNVKALKKIAAALGKSPEKKQADENDREVLEKYRAFLVGTDYALARMQAKPEKPAAASPDDAPRSVPGPVPAVVTVTAPFNSRTIVSTASSPTDINPDLPSYLDRRHEFTGARR